ncbi:MAG: hypothetical protein K6E10_07815 [Eubacterium sp.]|nr:hypothetical protein [Eubacterium sp.]
MAIGFLNSPLRFLWILIFIDPGFSLMPINSIKDKIKAKQIHKNFSDMFINQDYVPGKEDDSRFLKVRVLERKDEFEWPFKSNHLYELQIPRLFFAICYDKEGKCYLLSDEATKNSQIDIYPFDYKTISVTGIGKKHTDLTVEIEILRKLKSADKKIHNKV